MRQHLVYDLPTRLFHWLFAVLLVVAFSIGNFTDDDEAIFSYHMLAGLVLTFLVMLRLVWAVIGTKHATFRGLALRPLSLLQYFKGSIAGQKQKWAGHNPASSWAAVLMVVATLGLAISGYVMVSGRGTDAAEEVHEIFAYAFLIVVILHLAGLLLHSFQHRDGMALSMFNGRKQDVQPDDTINSPHTTAAALFVILVALFSGTLLKNFDGNKRTLNLLGSTWTLGEVEEHHDKHHRD